jgi:glycosyltransferase involved in cell wall biosynthesis
MIVGDITVSVIIPCFNAEETIITCLESVIAQTFEDYEVLIVDDGSIDKTVGILLSYIALHNLADKISLFRQSNAGPSAARNRGIKLSKGVWIAFLDSDDVWSPDKLALQLDAVRFHPELSLLGVRSGVEVQHSEQLSMISFKTLLYKNPFKTSGVIMRRAAALEVQFDERMKYSEDYRVWLIVAYRYKVAILNQVLCSAISNKRVFGERGLSANLSKMQEGEISNYKFLLDNAYINFPEFVKCLSYSYIKYIRRLTISSFSQFK